MGQGIFTRTISKEEINDLITSKGYQNESQVKALLDALVAAAPNTLDTLAEIAAALGNDPNFATTMTTLLAEKASTQYVNEQLAKKAELRHSHLANEVTFTDGDTFQQKYDSGSLTGPIGPQGTPGQAFKITASYSTLDELQQLFPTGTEGFFLIGTSQRNEVYYWDSVKLSWSSAGTLQGPQGLTPIFSIENGHLFVEYMDTSEVAATAEIVTRVTNNGTFFLEN